jgi:hypothetical protein
MKDNRTYEGPSVVTPFCRPAARPAGHYVGPVPRSRKLPAGHPVEGYIDMLKDEGFVSSAEHGCLRSAFAGLIRTYPTMRASAVNAIRKEMGRPENNKYVLFDKEEGYWKKARARGQAPIPGFELEEALSRFTVTPEEDPNRTVVFLRKEFETPVAPYVPPSLRMGEIFVYVILRMFRHHCRRQHSQ